jgi:hypothetical protein
LIRKDNLSFLWAEYKCQEVYVFHWYRIWTVEVEVWGRWHHFEPFIDYVQELVPDDVMKTCEVFTIICQGVRSQSYSSAGNLKHCWIRLRSLQFSAKGKKLEIFSDL